MRLLVLSDLHVEVAPFDPPDVQVDAVVLAGDIHNGAQALHWARAAFPRHEIVQIAGNHEFYDGEYHETLAAMRAAARETGIRFLENETTEIGGVRFLGCTLWTDFRVFETPGRPKAVDATAAMEASRRLFPDFSVIRMGEDRRAFSPQDSAALHADSRAWLDAALALPFAGATVVVTHHLPSWRSVHPQFAAWVSNAGFASDLDPLVERSDLWIHGHTHTSMRYPAGRSTVVCNPRGYPKGLFGAPPADPPQAAPSDPGEPVAFENPTFEHAFLLDVGRS